MTEQTKIGHRRAANAKESSEFYQERRKEIFAQAALVFEERGYQATTIADIAEKLGTDRASLYYYVGSKQELFQQVVREAAHSNVIAIEALAASKRRASEKLRLAFTTLMESYSASYPYINVFLQEKFATLSNEEDDWTRESKDWSDRYYKAMRRIVKQGVTDGEFAVTLPVSLVTMAVIGTINWAHRWYRPGGKLPPEQIGDGFAEILLKGLLAK
jgi:TetR/AcrR family transcriptional regulator, cholesterol catabolism regulator